jgi:hypothetical protein
VIILKGETLELWQKFCQQAAIEQDPTRLIELVAEINRLLTEKEQRLNQQRAGEKQAGSTH